MNDSTLNENDLVDEKMKIEIFSGFFTKPNIKHFVISALLYFVLIVPFKYLFALIPGNEAKAIAFLPVVLGILWGPASALGTAAANFAGDMLAQHVLYIGITGAIANFFQGYIPYKLWYTLKADESAGRLVHDMKSIIKFIYIAFITSLTVSSLLVMMGESSRTYLGGEVFLQLFLGQFDTTLLFGIPLLIIFSDKRTLPAAPKVKKKPSSNTGGSYYDLLLYAVAGVGGGYILIAGQSGHIVNPVTAFSCWIVMFLLLSVYMLKPIHLEESQRQKSNEIETPLLKKATFILLFVSALFIGFMGAVSYDVFQGNYEFGNLQAWNYFYINLVWAAHILFVISLLFLWQFENRIVRPIRLLTITAERLSARAYRHTGASKEDKLALKTGDEIERLANAIEVLARRRMRVAQEPETLEPADQTVKNP